MNPHRQEVINGRVIEEHLWRGKPADYEFKKLRTCKYEVIAEECRKLNEVRDSNFEQVAKQKLLRDSLGRFCSPKGIYNDWES